MNKPEYSDLYKFIVSLGLILIAFAILLPWLFLRESFDVLVSASEIANLTQTAQALISYRQNVSLWFVQNIFLISSIPAVAGLVTLISGLVFWRRKQLVVDQKDVLETEKLRLEVKKMSPEQIVEKVLKEVTEDVQFEEVENAPILEKPSQVSAINKYFEIENIVIKKLTGCFGSANVRPHLKVGNTEVDVLVRLSSKERAIFEIKSVRNPTNIFRRLRDITDTLVKAVESYDKLTTHQNIKGIGLLIVSNDYADSLEREHLDRVVVKVVEKIFIRIITLTEKEFLDLKCDEFRKMLTSMQFGKSA